VGPRILILLTAGVCGALCLGAFLLVRSPEGKEHRQAQSFEADGSTRSKVQAESTHPRLPDLEDPGRDETARAAPVEAPDGSLHEQKESTDPLENAIRAMNAAETRREGP
jgi:hypothetical protein